MRKIFKIVPVLLVLGLLLTFPVFAKLPPRLTVDTRLNGVYISKTLTISGWALNSSGMREVDFYFDGRLAGKTSCTNIRNDVQRAYPSYRNAARSGYSISLPFNLSTLREGSHSMRGRRGRE